MLCIFSYCFIIISSQIYFKIVYDPDNVLDTKTNLKKKKTKQKKKKNKQLYNE